MVKNIAIIGGGPSALLMFQRFVNLNKLDLTIDIFEKGNKLGVGMPYSKEGALVEHITNVSGNEVPAFITSVMEWINTLSEEKLKKFSIDKNNFNAYKVLPRLLFGEYLAHQFNELLVKAKEIGLEVNIHLNAQVTDVLDLPKENKVRIAVNNEFKGKYDYMIMCTGHSWPKTHEGKTPQYFDSPYPPEKLLFKINHPVAIKGASLTAIDAIKTLARQHGTFTPTKKGIPKYKLFKDCKHFKIVMHSRHGMLPAVRFHLEDSHLLKDSVLPKEIIDQNRADNDGFLLLDFIFTENFKKLLQKQDPEFYNEIKDLTIEEFVEKAMAIREILDPFQLFEAEYAEANQSIKRRESVYWKELLAVLSFAMNYPAKHFSAEDMLRLKKTLMPLISIVIAFVPQSSVEDLLALHKAGILEMLAVDNDSYEIPHQDSGAIYYFKDENGDKKEFHYKTFINCVGQPHLNYEDFPFKSLIKNQSIAPAKLKFNNAQIANKLLEEGVKGVVKSTDHYYLNVPGIAINDYFQALDCYGALNPRLYIMAVPYISGYNPDYSGLDFGEAASEIIVKNIFNLAELKAS